MDDSGILDTVLRQARLADDVTRRPWPLPEGAWSQAQTRNEVLLVHWPVALDEAALLLPPELSADTFEGEAWLGIAAYRVSGLRARGLPPLPGLSTFPQLEVFTFVTVDERPGIWLESLEAPKQLLVEAAKRTHRLPAYRAHLSMEVSETGVLFEAGRDGASFRVSYAAAGEPFTPEPGTREHFLTERYALYTADGGRVYRAELHHAPWALRPAQVTVEAATLAPLPLEGEPRAFYADRQDLLLWPLEEL